MHPSKHATSVAKIGEWQKFRCNLGDYAALKGLTIKEIMFAYDQGNSAVAGEEHTAYLDNVYIGNAKINTKPIEQTIKNAEKIDLTGIDANKVSEFNNALSYAKLVLDVAINDIGAISASDVDDALVALIEAIENLK